VRPIYVAVGECPRCRMIERRLWKLDSSKADVAAVCEKCLYALGHEVPKARTAEDITEADCEFKRTGGK